MKRKVQSSKIEARSLKNTVVVLCSLLLALCSSSAQTISATLKADSNQIQIGDPLNIKLTVKHSKELQPLIPNVFDTLGNMEIVNHSSIDTTSEGNSVVLSQIFTVSAYDSGEYHAGALTIFFKNSGGFVDSILSNTIPVTVNTLDVDTAKPFKPIKAPLDVPYAWKEFIYYFILLWFLLMLAIGGYIMWKQQKQKKPDTYARPKPKDPAHIWARKELKKIDEEKLWQKDEVKLYYTRLTDILRLYLEYRYGWLALESTTEEIAAEISSYPINDVAKKLLLEVLRGADLVKFAKMLPMPDANTKALQQAFDFIDVTAPVETKTEETK